MIRFRKGTVMHRFNFDIDSGAHFTWERKRPKSTRDLLRLTIEKKQNGERVRAASLNSPDAEDVAISQIDGPQPPAPRQSKAGVNKRLRSSRQLRYRGFVISTVSPAPRVWIAYFGRADGRAIFWRGTACPIAETGLHEAEVLAVSDAMLSIEDLLAWEAAAAK
jgi:hypothetical protein